MTREARLTIALTEEEKETIRRLAFDAKKTPSTFVRDMLLAETSLPEHIHSFFGDDAALSTQITVKGTRN